MPFYEYECQSCKFYTELMQKITDPPLTKCPSCGKKTMQKLISAPVFRLKGGGWYETDFKSDSENKRNLAAPDKEEAKSESATGAKTEAKAEAKPESKPAATESKPTVPAARQDSGASRKSSSRVAAAKGRPGHAAKAAPARAAARPSSKTPAKSKAKGKSKARGRR